MTLFCRFCKEDSISFGRKTKKRGKTSLSLERLTKPLSLVSLYSYLQSQDSQCTVFSAANSALRASYQLKS